MTSSTVEEPLVLVSAFGVARTREGALSVMQTSKTSPVRASNSSSDLKFALQVGLACKLADDDFFRPGMAQKMSVQPAKFEMHGTQYVPKKKGNKKKNSREKAKMADKVLGWGGFDDKLKPTQVKNLFWPTFTFTLKFRVRKC